jgi:hypothetical protein
MGFQISYPPLHTYVQLSHSMNQVMSGDTTTVIIQHAIQIMNGLHRSVSDAGGCGSREEPLAPVWGSRWIESFFSDVRGSKPMLLALQANAIVVGFCESPMIVSQAAFVGRDSSRFVRNGRRVAARSDHPSRGRGVREEAHPRGVSADSIARRRDLRKQGESGEEGETCPPPARNVSQSGEHRGCKSMNRIKQRKSGNTDECESRRTERERPGIRREDPRTE